jgi:hypothetical protein
MEVLREMLEVAKFNGLEEKAVLLERDLNTLLARHRDNPVTDLGSNNLDVKFEEAMKRLNAAKSALAIVNKIGTQIKQAQDPQKKEKLMNFKKQNVSRIMKNLNVLRLMVKHLGEELAKENQATIGAPQVGSKVHEGANPKLVFKKKDLKKSTGVKKVLKKKEEKKKK